MIGKSAEEIRKRSMEKVKQSSGKSSYPKRKRFDSPEDLLNRTAPKLARQLKKKI